jgi:hypothetical protein
MFIKWLMQIKRSHIFVGRFINLLEELVLKPSLVEGFFMRVNIDSDVRLLMHRIS